MFHTIECHLFAASEDTTVKKRIVWVVFLTGARDFGHHIPHLLHVFWQYLTARSRFAQMTTSTPGAEQNAG